MALDVLELKEDRQGPTTGITKLTDLFWPALHALTLASNLAQIYPA